MQVQEQKSWFARNWGWVLGGGCLTLIIIFVIGIGSLVYKVVDGVKESEPYKYALLRTIENEKVVDLLGEPIETNGIGSTSISYNNGLSTSELVIPIKGPKDEGSIFVSAEKVNDEWAYTKLYVKIDGETGGINLLEVETEQLLDDL